ncbi:MAG: hypothetical protein ACXWNK_02305 [Vulcanimicrobiaceae bacterium]
MTKNGIAFTRDLRGRVYALDSATGAELWHDDTGSAIVAPISAYRVDGNEYLAVVTGEGGNQQTPNLPAAHGSHVVAYALNAKQPTVNDTAGQPAVVVATGAPKTESAMGSAAPGGAVPYTIAQVQAGKAVYQRYCTSCHGA